MTIGPSECKGQATAPLKAFPLKDSGGIKFAGIQFMQEKLFVRYRSLPALEDATEA